METKRDRTAVIAVVTGVITLLLGLCLGALAGGVGGYLVGRQSANRGALPLPQPVLPGPSAGPTRVIVQEVVAGSPAEAAGMQAGDVITEFNGITLDSTHNLRDLLAQASPGDRAQLTVERNGKPMTVDVQLGARPTGGSGAYLGVRYSEQNATP